MRTTLAINDAILDRAKQRAREQGVTLGSYVEEALRVRLIAPEPPHEPVDLPVFSRGNGLAPGIDPLSNRSMYDALDEDGQLSA